MITKMALPAKWQIPPVAPFTTSTDAWFTGGWESTTVPDTKHNYRYTESTDVWNARLEAPTGKQSGAGFSLPTVLAPIIFSGDVVAITYSEPTVSIVLTMWSVSAYGDQCGEDI